MSAVKNAREAGEFDDPIVGLHYQVYGYVGREGIVPPPDNAPLFRTFTAIEADKPKDCRFVVVRMVKLRRNPDKSPSTPLFLTDTEPSGPYLVWDLDDDQLKRGMRTAPSGLLMPPPPLWMSESEDGMLMKAVHFYEHHP